MAVWASDRLTSLGRKHVVWRSPSTGPVSKEVWAAEIARLDGRWYIYFAASDGENRNHLSYVLAARTDDPLGAYDLHGPLFTGDEHGTNIWSIDLTVLEHRGRRYGLWSGWRRPGVDQQDLYIAPMSSPTCVDGPRVRIARAGTHAWQRIEDSRRSRGLLEGPQVLQRGGRTFVAYSCAASWLTTYKLGLLELVGDDPLDPASWRDFPEPVFGSAPGVTGVGHGSFVETPDGQWWHAFHAKRDSEPGWRRGIHVQPMRWRDDGTPDLGAPLPPEVPLEVPSGTPQPVVSEALSLDLADDAVWDRLDYYGHHQFVRPEAAGIDLGVPPAHPVNDYRSGEKLVIRDGRWSDVRVESRFTILDGDRAAGILVRTTAPAVGYDAQRGYFVGVVRDLQCLMIGRTDGAAYVELARADLPVDVGAAMTLVVEVRGDEIRASCGGVDVDCRDSRFTTGTAGLRVVDTAARFHSLSVRPLD